MMGIYRFLLAQTVLLSHFGGIPSEASRVAVYSFYTVSGFLIFRVLETKYLLHSWRGLGPFFVNRFLRLFPLFVLLNFMAIAIAYSFPGGFDNGPGEERLYILRAFSLQGFWNDLLFFIPHFDFTGILPVIFSAGPTLPQVWSVGIEMYCYLCAPLVILLAKNKIKYWAIILFLLLAYFITLLAVPHPRFHMEDAVYKNFFPGFFMFVVGGCLWQIRKRTAYRVDAAKSFFILAFYFWFLLFWANNRLLGSDLTPVKFFVDVMLSIPFTALAIFTTSEGAFKKISDTLGELSYGIYLNQYIIAFIMMLMTQFCAVFFNLNSIFGAGYNRLEFGIHAAVFSTIAAYMSYITVEKYIEKLRKRIASSQYTQS